MDIAAIPPAPAPDRRTLLMEKAQELEATFLAEMLAHTGLGATEGSFSGGSGEDQFASFLRREQARLMVQSGGIGLAELVFNSMTRADHDISE